MGQNSSFQFQNQELFNMRINLIVPPNPYLGDDMRNPPLGLLYMAAVAEKNEIDVKITDLRGKQIDTFKKELSNSDIYGITAATPDYHLALQIAKFTKSLNPESWVVLGGTHATAVPQSIDSVFDKVVIGEGEHIMLDIVRDFEAKKDNKRLYHAEQITDLDALPFPAYHLMPFDSAFSKSAFSVKGAPAAAIMTSRGCPYACSFCASSSMWHRKVRFRSPDNVINEIKKVMQTYGINYFRFHDDTMTLRSNRLEELCTKIGRLGIKWRAATRIDSSSRESFIMMKNAGCEEIALGIESLCQEALDKSDKKIKVEDSKRIVHLAKEIGLDTRLYFIIGLPGEKPGFTDRLIQFVNETKPDGIDVSTLVPYPGSDIYANPEKYGIKLKEQDFSKYHMTLGLKNGEIDREFAFVHDVMAEEELKKERESAIKFIKSHNLVKNF
ncbi:MAG: radical SAM protein [archaeon]|nr:radical SAM protein [archaeon]